MVQEKIDAYLDTLSGYVFDNDKVVTYKWLSKECEIHVNVAKQVLSEFWRKHESSDSIDSTILLMGYTNPGEMRMEVVKHKDLASVKSKYSSILSEHVYSVEKSLEDLEILAITDPGDVRFSAVRNSKEKKLLRSEEEILNLKYGSKLSNDIKTDEKNLQDEKKSQKEAPAQPGKKREAASFNNFFQKKSEDAAAKKEEKPKSHSKPAGGKMENFFSKKVSPKSEEKKEPVKVEEKKEAVKVEEKKETAKEVEPKLSKAKEAKKKQSEKRGKKRDRSEEALKKKKRMRVFVESDSSEEEEEEERELEELRVEDVPDEEVQQMEVSAEEEEEEKGNKEEGPSTTSPETPRRRKVLKTVDKTFTDEDGYLVTKKEKVYVSCSEGEDEEKEKGAFGDPKPTGKKDQVKKRSPPDDSKNKGNGGIKKSSAGKKSNSKQTTLTSFFKKA